MIPVVRLDPIGQWDQTFTDELLVGALWPHHLDLRPKTPWPDAPGIILVIPGRYWVDKQPSVGHWSQINTMIQKYDWVIAFRVGDEEDWFEPKNIVHPNIRWWVQTPRTDHHYTARFFGVGFTPHATNPPPIPGVKNIDVFLAGQCTHERRYHCFSEVEHLPCVVEIHASGGFTQGLPHDEYADKMARTKICPAPSGPVTPDSFRLYEALQFHAIPVADGQCPGYDASGYWRMLHPDAPFPIVDDWTELPALVESLQAGWPANVNRITAWWMREKQRYAHDLQTDLASVAAMDGDDAGSAITAVIPVSPIKSHPDIAILEAAITSIRHHLPDTNIVITFDGVRAEQEHLRDAYEESIRRTLWRCDHWWKNVTPLIFDKHVHQIGMMRHTMQHIATPLLLYVEQDCPLVVDETIDWSAICALLLSGDAGVVRFSHETLILKAHEHMMHGRHNDFTRTSQWSQRPHVASKSFYQRALNEFSPEASCFIEDKMASVLECANHDYGMLGWLQWPCWIYTPQGGSIKRSYHLDGRDGEPKYDDDQRF